MTLVAVITTVFFAYRIIGTNVRALGKLLHIRGFGIQTGGHANICTSGFKAVDTIVTKGKIKISPNIMRMQWVTIWPITLRRLVDEILGTYIHLRSRWDLEPGRWQAPARLVATSVTC